MTAHRAVVEKIGKRGEKIYVPSLSVAELLSKGDYENNLCNFESPRISKI